MGAFARARGLETHRVSVLLAFLGGFSPLDGEPGPRRGYPRRAAVLRGRLTHDSFDVASEVLKFCGRRSLPVVIINPRWHFWLRRFSS